MDDDKNHLYIVMEYCDKGDVYHLILDHQKRKEYIDEDYIWHISLEVLKGLHQLHSMKIYHRDIKSANIFLDKKGGVKIGDMNVSKIAKKGLLLT